MSRDVADILDTGRGPAGPLGERAGEGLEETLTVQRLGLTGALERTLRTTNIIENLMGSVEGYTRRVKRWLGGQMIQRWVASALVEAERALPARAGLPRLWEGRRRHCRRGPAGDHRRATEVESANFLAFSAVVVGYRWRATSLT